jgi:hypothetical protein
VDVCHAPAAEVVDNRVDVFRRDRHHLSCPEGPDANQDRRDRIKADREREGRSGHFVVSAFEEGVR